MPELPVDVTAWLPTFFIIGAPKAGTTSLHEYLAVHPEIAMSTPKEPMCFVWPDWEQRVATYRELLGGEQAPVRGESSTAYASYPWRGESADRIRAAVPDARLIYVVRDPIPRTLSHYAQNVWDGLAVRTFDELMDDLEDDMNIPVWASRFATQLERWIERFGSDRVLVLEQRDLQRNRHAVLRRVFEFLDVDRDFTSPEWDVDHNTAVQHRRATALAQRLGRAGRAVQRIPLLERALTEPIPAPVPTPEQRRRLARLLLPEAQRLRAMTDLDLAHWTLWEEDVG